MSTIIKPIGSTLPIRPEFIPDTIAQSIGQVALDGFKRYKRDLRDHPAEERAFQARVAEVRERYGLT